MEFEYTDSEYLVECTDGCGEITDWLQSRFLAEQAIKNHADDTAHSCQILQRLRSERNNETGETDKNFPEPTNESAKSLIDKDKTTDSHHF